MLPRGAAQAAPFSLRASAQVKTADRTTSLSELSSCGCEESTNRAHAHSGIFGDRVDSGTNSATSLLGRHGFAQLRPRVVLLDGALGHLRVMSQFDA